MTEQATLFFKAYKAAGGPIDELVSDWEQHDWGMFGFESGREDDEPCPSSPANATAACRGEISDRNCGRSSTVCR